MASAAQIAELAKLRTDLAAENAHLKKMIEEHKKILEEQKKIEALANKLCEKQKEILKNTGKPSAKNVPVSYWTYVPYAYYPYYRWM